MFNKNNTKNDLLLKKCSRLCFKIKNLLTTKYIGILTMVIKMKFFKKLFNYDEKV